MASQTMDIKKDEMYILRLLRDEVVCTYVTPKEELACSCESCLKIELKTERVAVFEFKNKVAAYHAIPFTLPVAVCGEYLAELPEMAQA